MLSNRSDVGRHTDKTTTACGIPQNKSDVDELLERLFRIELISSCANYNSHDKNVKQNSNQHGPYCNQTAKDTKDLDLGAGVCWGLTQATQ